MNDFVPEEARGLFGMFLVLSSRGPYGFSLHEISADEADARRETKAIGGVLVVVPVDVLADERPDNERPPAAGGPTPNEGDRT